MGRPPSFRKLRGQRVLRASAPASLGVLLAIVTGASLSSRAFLAVPSPAAAAAPGPTLGRRALLAAAGASLLGATAPLPALAKAIYISGIKLDKTSAEPTIGLKLNSKDEDGGILIEGVDEGGLVDRWNAANPDKAIQKGDRIIKVNGQTGLQQMVNDCRARAKTLDITIKRSPPKPPDALLLNGREGSRAKEINGRWSIIFGKFVNGKAVYKRDGTDGYYLMFNDCGQFQMASKAVGSCDGFALKTEQGWQIDEEIDPKVKMEVAKEDEKDPYPDLVRAIK